MKTFLPVAIALALPFGLAAQDKKDAGGDKIGKDKAPNVAKKAFAEILKKKGAAISASGEMSAGPGPKVTGTFEGVMKKEFAGVKGTLEIYAKGTSTLVNTGARFDSPDEIEAQQQQQAHLFKNPSLLITEASKLTASASYGSDETIDGKECREIALPADEATVKIYLKELGERLNRQFKGFGGGFGGRMNFANALDEKNSTGLYQIYVGKDDLLIHRLVFVLKPQVKPNALPPQVPKLNLDQRWDVKFAKWDEEVSFEIPAVIKAKWGLK